MKVFYIEANEDELKVRPTIMNTITNFLESVTRAIGAEGFDNDEHGEDDFCSEGEMKEE